jgi:hypothetical protein
MKKDETMTAHLIFSQETEQPIKWFDKFDTKAIRQAIYDHLENNPTDCVEHCKEPLKNDLKRFVGYTIINFYKLNPKTGLVCKVVTRKNKEYLQTI